MGLCGMAEDKNKPDLLRGPVELAMQMFQAQLDNFQGSVVETDPVQQWRRDNAIRMKDIRRG